MAVEASSSDPGSSLFDDVDFYSALHEYGTENYDEEISVELQLQEAIDASLIMANTKKSSNSRSESASCTICTDTKSAAEMFANGDCSHSFCTDCISNHVAARLEVSMTVRCPEPKCAVVLDPEICRSFVPKEVLERWGDALFEAMILKTKTVYCPYGDCSAAMIEDGEEAVTAAECMSCRRMFCAQCKVGWHGEMECSEFERLRKEVGGGDRDDVMTVKLADSEKWKRCPNCKIYVEKIAGCLHIVCRCGTEFCYSCGSKWGGNHACPSSAFERTVHRGR